MSRFSKTYREVGIFQNSISNVGILPNFPSFYYFFFQVFLVLGQAFIVENPYQVGAYKG